MQAPTDAWKNAARFSTLPADRARVGWITLCLSTERARPGLVCPTGGGGASQSRRRAGAGGRVENAARFSTLPADRVRVGWITLCLSTEGARPGRVCPTRGGGASQSRQRAGAGERVENAARFSTLPADRVRVGWITLCLSTERARPGVFARREAVASQSRRRAGAGGRGVRGPGGEELTGAAAAPIPVSPYRSGLWTGSICCNGRPCSSR